MIWACIILTFLIAFFAYYSLKFGMIIIRIQDCIQDSLDIMDQKHMSITEILQRPLFYDSPEVRQVLRDINDARKALHTIAFELSKDFKDSSSE